MQRSHNKWVWPLAGRGLLFSDAVGIPGWRKDLPHRAVLRSHRGPNRNSAPLPGRPTQTCTVKPAQDTGAGGLHSGPQWEPVASTCLTACGYTAVTGSTQMHRFAGMCWLKLAKSHKH